ncbi:MAG: NUDIX hydrolase, partial [Gammaproteobacteria bacterium]|nr:NUDIX hydrolase [Gammaproteobacteria bacterium]
GQYSYEKWGGVCTVDVYPMEVTKVLPEAEWAENYRGRSWLPPGQAAKKLNQKELVPLLEQLAAQLTGKT